MSQYRQLDKSKIIAEVDTLTSRIDERFPGSSLSAVSRDLGAIAREASARIEKIQSPHWPVRILAILSTIGVLAILGVALAGVNVTESPNKLFDLVQGIESAINDVIFISIAIFFLFTLETRLKRRIALSALHELRSLAHIVDMHQLTKDPEQVLTPEMRRTASSPTRTMTRFELGRYLDYCSELLALAGKTASLYAQHMPDPVILSTVNEVESLTIGLSRKIWQKIMILDTIDVRARGLEPQ